MATHSSVLAWEIPWTAEPRGLKSMGLQTVRQDLITLIIFSLTYSTICKDDITFMLRMCAVFEHGSPVLCFFLFFFSSLSISVDTFGWGGTIAFPSYCH